VSNAVAGSEPQQGQNQGRPLLTTAIVLLVASLVFGVLGTFLIVSPKDGIVDLFRQQSHATPITIQRHFDEGIYFIWQDKTDRAQIPTDDVSVTDANGTAVRVYEPAADETLAIGQVEYVDVAAFKITAAGTYRVNIATADSHVIVGPSLWTAGKRIIPGGLMTALAFGLFCAGLFMLIFWLVRRNRNKRPTVAPTLTVPPPQGAWPLGPGYAPVPLNQNFPPPVVGPPPLSQPPVTQPAVTQPPVMQPTLVQPIAQPPVAPPPPVVPVIPAGWYPDSQRPGGRRYWDGTAWTEHRA
jgi:uncharacterized membrane protein